AGLHSDRRSFRTDLRVTSLLCAWSFHRAGSLDLVRTVSGYLFQPGRRVRHRDPKDHGGWFVLSPRHILRAPNRLSAISLRINLVAGLYRFRTANAEWGEIARARPGGGRSGIRDGPGTWSFT